ncbi:MAG: HIT family hydrolase [Acidobacteria bacterium RIFCSPLOWO2_12_FULL_67_14b]|nr:MAG: HIT family hydrolase [Acidobacteria bacterium RIFCSPLOWO2_12_FULL_67_14b]
MERIWSPWRHTYVTRAEDANDCVFCAAQATETARALVVHEAPLTYVILNLYPYNAGHLMVVPRRHVASLARLTRDELNELALLTQRAEQVLTEAYQPQGINVGMNLGRPAGAGIVDHLHVHLVPRWNGDTNFMSVVGEVRVLPEELPRTVERLRPLFAGLS